MGLHALEDGLLRREVEKELEKLELTLNFRSASVERQMRQHGLSREDLL